MLDDTLFDNADLLVQQLLQEGSFAAKPALAGETLNANAAAAFQRLGDDVGVFVEYLPYLVRHFLAKDLI